MKDKDLLVRRLGFRARRTPNLVPLLLVYVEQPRLAT